MLTRSFSSSLACSVASPLVVLVFVSERERRCTADPAHAVALVELAAAATAAACAAFFAFFS